AGLEPATSAAPARAAKEGAARTRGARDTPRPARMTISSSSEFGVRPRGPVVGRVFGPRPRPRPRPRAPVEGSRAARRLRLVGHAANACAAFVGAAVLASWAVGHPLHPLGGPVTTASSAAAMVAASAALALLGGDPPGPS